MSAELPIMMPALAEIFLLVAACAILVIDIYAKRGELTYVLSLLALLGAAICTVTVTNETGAQAVIAFGAVTLPHQLARIILAEQLYRSMTLMSGHPYHRA